MTDVAPIHDFVGKLSQPHVIQDVRRYAERIVPDSITNLFLGARPVAQGPLSINLDLTVACNHACPHCIDESILNTGAKFPFDEVVSSLTTLRIVGLRSVIFIGGGEPTLYPEFEQVVQVAATLGLGVGIVSNGSRPERLAAAARFLRAGDWIRLSIDAGSDETFQRTHRPRKAMTLDAICAGPRAIKAVNPDVSCGFSFVVICPEMLRFDARLTVNDHELALAARVAKEFAFDYISFKPFLVRDTEGKEVLPFVSPSDVEERSQGSSEYVQIRPPRATTPLDVSQGLGNDSVSRIHQGLEEAATYETECFRVIPSLNLFALFDSEVLAAGRNQPKRCHMQALRQVVTPTGVYGCPAYRGDPRSLIAERDGYVSVAKYRGTAAQTAAQIERFDASTECRNITCLYNSTNWWLERFDSRERMTATREQEEEIPIFL